MKIEFRINKTPPTASDIEIARVQIEQRKKKAERFCLPLMSILIVGIVITAATVRATLSNTLTNFSLLGGGTIISLFYITEFIIGGWIAIATIKWKKYWTAQNRIWAIIELPCAEIALSLSRKYPEIDAYRRAAIQDRRLVNGDLEAMKAFAKIQESIELNANLVNQQKTAFDAIHKDDLPNITDIPSVPKSWIDHAYPLQQISIRLQGTRHSDRQSVIAQLDEVLARLQQGDESGEEHDDDFGYNFTAESSSNGPSFFDKPCGSR